MKVSFSKLCLLIRSIIPSIIFNFRYLPFNQARKLPILLYNTKLHSLLGNVIIDVETISFGMVKLGFPEVLLYPNSGFVYENFGGTIVFRGHVKMGNNSALSIGRGGILELGNNVSAFTSLKMVCYSNIKICNDVSIGWDCIIMDTDLHATKTMTENGDIKNKAFGSIIVGRNVWIANGCLILKNSVIPDYTIIGAKSVISKKLDTPSYSLVAGNPPRLIKKNVYRDFNDDIIIYNN